LTPGNKPLVHFGFFVKRGYRIAPMAAVHNYLQILDLDFLKFFLVSVGTVVEPSFHSTAQDRINACLVKQEFIA
jgi:hypothetical protein